LQMATRDQALKKFFWVMFHIISKLSAR
jgi:hypothetical protein